MDRKTQVALIIADREPWKKKIQSRRKALHRVLDTIDKLEILRQQISSNGSPSMQESLSQLNLLALRTRIDNEYQRLAKPESRFSRHTLNIGVFGRTGQGKSTLLQSLSGLGSDVIPTGNKGVCTGARYLILHDNDQINEGAKITFYTQDELVNEVLAPYYQVLRRDAPSIKFLQPAGFRDFESQPLPEQLNGNLSSSVGNTYKHLLKYKTHLQSYKPLLSQPEKSIKDISKVREFVAQDDIDGNPLHYHMAVKKAEIRKRFIDLDIAQFGLLDVPGLGDMRIADEQYFAQAFAEQVDIALFLIKPDALRGTFTDVNFGLYDLAHANTEGFFLKDISFIVLNHFQSDDEKANNGVNCSRLKDEIQGGMLGVKGAQVEVQDCFIADCTLPTEAKDKVLDPILDYLLSAMKRLDEQHMTYWDQRCSTLKQEIETTLSSIGHLSNTDITKNDEEEIFKKRRDQIWQHLTTALVDLLDGLRRESSKTDNEFSKYFHEKFVTCRQNTGLPQYPQDIEDLRRSEGSYSKAFIVLTDQVRTHLTHHFIDMDERLGISMSGVKERAASIFLKELEFVNLLGNISASQFLQEIIKPEYALSLHLHETFETFHRYQLSLRGYFQSIIRNGGFLVNLQPDAAVIKYLFSQYASSRVEQIQGLDQKTMGVLKNVALSALVGVPNVGQFPTILNNALQGLANLGPHKIEELKENMNKLFWNENEQRLITDYSPDEVLQALKDAHKATVDAMEKRLESFFSEPGKAALAVVEEFVDQACRASSARDDWDTFFRANKAAMWSDESSQIRQWQRFQQQWQKQVEDVVIALDAL